MAKSKLNFVAYFLVTFVVILGINNENKKARAKLESSPTLNIALLISEDKLHSINIMSINQINLTTTFISLPQDTIMPIPCTGTKKRLVDAYYYGDQNWSGKGGGKVCLTQSLENKFSLVDLKYFYLSLDSLVDLVAKLGGIPLTPTSRVCDEKNCLEKNKTVTLSGDLLKLYMKNPTNDVARTGNHRKVLVSLFKTLNALPKTRLVELGAYVYAKGQSNLLISEILAFMKTKSQDYKALLLQGKMENGQYILNEKHVLTVKNILNG